MRDAVTPPGRIDEALGPLAQLELRRSGLRLRFPEALEERYRDDTAEERAGHMHNFALLTLPLYLSVVLLATFVFAYLQNVLHTILLCAVVTGATLLALPQFRITVPYWRRKGALILLCTVLCLAPILFVALEPSEPRLQDLILCALPLSFVLLFSRLYFPAGTLLSLLTTLAYITLVFTLPVAPPPALQAFLIGIVMLQALPFLVALHSVERNSRRLYLHGLLERMNYERAIASNLVLTSLSFTDPLTGVANRRRMDAELTRFCEKEDARGSFLMLDIDWFKRFNDHYGHPVGDRCLQEVAGCLASVLRDGDLLGRMGGEEFGVLLPDMVMQESVLVAERLRGCVAAFPFMVGTQIVKVTISVGVAAIVPHDDPARVVEAADKALYRAKKAGRNQVGGPWLKQLP